MFKLKKQFFSSFDWICMIFGQHLAIYTVFLQGIRIWGQKHWNLTARRGKLMKTNVKLTIFIFFFKLILFNLNVGLDKPAKNIRSRRDGCRPSALPRPLFCVAERSGSTCPETRSESPCSPTPRRAGSAVLHLGSVHLKHIVRTF